MLVERHLPLNEVAVYDSMSRDALVHRDIADAERERISIYRGDVLDREALLAAISDFRPTHVVHAPRSRG